MKQNHKISLSLTLVISILLALVAVAAAGKQAVETVAYADQRDSAAAAVTWLYQDKQNSDGGFGTDFSTGEPASSIASTLDAALAIAAPGYNPAAQYFGADKTAIDYLIENAADMVTFAAIDGGANGKVILALAAANENARDFVGHDYVAQLNGQYEPSGSFNNTTAFSQGLAILAVATVGEPVPQKAVEWLEDLQAPDGSWDDGFGTLKNTDATAMSIMALLAGGRELSDPSVAAGLTFLADSQLASGGWEYGSGFGENANSTALAVQALSAADENFYAADGVWAKNGSSPMMALLSWQNSSGAFQADFGQGKFDDLFATVQSVAAVTGKPYPLPSRFEAAQNGLVCLAGLQDIDSGGWEQFAGFGVNAAGTSRSIEAIAAAGGVPQSVDWTPGSVNAVKALENETPVYVEDDVARGGRSGIVAQGVVAAGEDAADFAGHSLPEDIAGFLNEDGEYADTNFGIVAHSEAMLGLLVSGNEVDPSAVDFLVNAQTAGDWGTADQNGIALNVLGRLHIPFGRAVDVLMATQQADGGWGFGIPSNTNSTSEAVQGLVQQAENPFAPKWSVVNEGRIVNPADVIMAQQKANGCWPNLYGPGEDPFGTTDAIILFSQEPGFTTYSWQLPVIANNSQ